MTVGTINNRHLHSAVVFEDKLIVFGGFSKTTDCNMCKVFKVVQVVLTWFIIYLCSL